MDQKKIDVKTVSPDWAFEIAVAIPARNEAGLINQCLAALDHSAAGIGQSKVSVVVLVNNSTDRTAEYARSYKPTNVVIVVKEVHLGQGNAHAGGARSSAMNEAAKIAGPDGIIMTTDADSEVSPDWIAANLSELNRGADAVAGTIAFKSADRLRLMPMLLARQEEWKLADLQAQLVTMIDPLEHDPWPSHIWEWGASLAVTVKAYVNCGGIPSIPLAEDRAFAQLLHRHDFKLRHSHAPLVFTSGRLEGRSPQGFADLIHDYCLSPDTPCDAAIEPTAVLIQRLKARKSLRERYGKQTGFGEHWHQFETTDLKLSRRRVLPCELPEEIAFATLIVERFKQASEDLIDNHAYALVK